MMGGVLRFRLRAQILVTLTVLLSAALLVIYFVVRGVHRNALTEQRRRDATEAVSLVAATAPLVCGTAPGRRAFVGQLESLPAVRSALLLDRRMRVLAPEGGQPFWHPDKVALLQDMMDGGQPVFRYPDGPEEPPLWVLVPVSPPPSPEKELDPTFVMGLDDGPERVAAIALLFVGRQPLVALMRSEKLLLLFLAPIVAVILLVAHLALTRLVVVPVRRLIRTVERVAASELPAIEEPREQRPGSELAVLGDATDRMLGRLKENEKRIRSQMDRLKGMNQKLVQAQESLIRSEKLASVGQLAAGVAHEIGNPIAIILGYLEVLRDDAEEGSDLADYLADIQDATDRVNHIIRDLLDFSRPQKEEIGSANVRRVADSSVKLLRPQGKFRAVDVQVDMDDELHVNMSEGRLQQVLVNLLMNAADAMEGRGCIEIVAEAREEQVRISVSDEGPGIGPADRRRVFDPFFTTKQPGEGTGLGLAICYSLVSACEGTISVESAPGKGTTFVIDLWKPKEEA